MKACGPRKNYNNREIQNFIHDMLTGKLSYKSVTPTEQQANQETPVVKKGKTVKLHRQVLKNIHNNTYCVLENWWSEKTNIVPRDHVLAGWQEMEVEVGE